MSHVLFWDIDGTLLSTGRAGILALERAAADLLGVRADFTDLRTAGMTDAEVVALCLETSGRAGDDGLLEAFIGSYESHLPEHLPLRQGRVLPGVREILEHVAEDGRVVSLLLTGNTRAGAAAKLAHYDLAGYFDGGAFSVAGRTRGEIARHALELAVDQTGEADVGERSVVIGDTPADVACGKAIGVRTVAVASGSHSAEELAACEPWVVLGQLPAPEDFLTLVGVS